MKNKSWLKVGVALVLVAWAFLFPPTRAILIFLLPLGSGFDDLIVLGALGLAVFIWFVGGWTHIPDILNRLFKKG